MSKADDDAFDKTWLAQREPSKVVKRKSTAIKLTPDMLAECGTEDGHQAALFMWAGQQTRFDLSLLYAIPNGGARGDDRRSAAIRGAKLKATGVRKGWPDVGLPVPRQRVLSRADYPPEIVGYAGCYVELKRPQSDGKAAGRLGDGQDPIHVRLREAGNAVCVAYGWVAAAHAIGSYLTGYRIEAVYWNQVSDLVWCGRV